VDGNDFMQCVAGLHGRLCGTKADVCASAEKRVIRPHRGELATLPGFSRRRNERAGQKPNFETR
jgi:hypothetical protein